MVTACPMPDCGLSGATTTTSPKGKTASVNASIPLEYTPSSLVTRMRGRLFGVFMQQTYCAYVCLRWVYIFDFLCCQKPLTFASISRLNDKEEENCNC